MKVSAGVVMNSRPVAKKATAKPAAAAEDEEDSEVESEDEDASEDEDESEDEDDEDDASAVSALKAKRKREKMRSKLPAKALRAFDVDCALKETGLSAIVYLVPLPAPGAAPLFAFDAPFVKVVIEDGDSPNPDVTDSDDQIDEGDEQVTVAHKIASAANVARLGNPKIGTSLVTHRHALPNYKNQIFQSEHALCFTDIATLQLYSANKRAGSAKYLTCLPIDNDQDMNTFLFARAEVLKKGGAAAGDPWKLYAACLAPLPLSAADAAASLLTLKTPPAAKAPATAVVPLAKDPPENPLFIVTVYRGVYTTGKGLKATDMKTTVSSGARLASLREVNEAIAPNLAALGDKRQSASFLAVGSVLTDLTAVLHDEDVPPLWNFDGDKTFHLRVAVPLREEKNKNKGKRGSSGGSNSGDGWTPAGAYGQEDDEEDEEEEEEGVTAGALRSRIKLVVEAAFEREKYEPDEQLITYCTQQVYKNLDARKKAIDEREMTWPSKWPGPHPGRKPKKMNGAAGSPPDSSPAGGLMAMASSPLMQQMQMMQMMQMMSGQSQQLAAQVAPAGAPAADAPVPKATTEQRLATAQKLKDDGIITEDEYTKKRASILLDF